VVIELDGITHRDRLQMGRDRQQWLEKGCHPPTIGQSPTLSSNPINIIDWSLPRA
jgi:hypothetical protein